jgi:hypothetical protein
MKSGGKKTMQLCKVTYLWKPTPPCKLWKLQSESHDLNPTGHLRQVGEVFCKSHGRWIRTMQSEDENQDNSERPAQQLFCLWTTTNSVSLPRCSNQNLKNRRRMGQQRRNWDVLLGLGRDLMPLAHRISGPFILWTASPTSLPPPYSPGRATPPLRRLVPAGRRPQPPCAPAPPCC